MEQLYKAIDQAEQEYGWNISVRETGAQEAGYNKLYTYEVTVDGQYAEDDAFNFFGGFGFYDVSEMTTDHSFAILEVVIDSY